MSDDEDFDMNLDEMLEAPLSGKYGPRESYLLPSLSLPAGFQFASLFCIAHWISGNRPLRDSTEALVKVVDCLRGSGSSTSAGLDNRGATLNFTDPLINTLHMIYGMPDHPIARLQLFFDRNPNLFRHLCSLGPRLYCMPFQTWNVPGGADPFQSIITSLRTTPTPELTQLFLLEDPRVTEVPFGAFWCSQPTGGGAALQLRWMLVSTNRSMDVPVDTVPALALVTAKHLELFGHGRAQCWQLDHDSLCSFCKTAHVHVVAYRVLLDCGGQRPRGDPEYNAPAESRRYDAPPGQLYRRLAMKKSEWDRDSATVAKFLVMLVKYPFLFFQEAGLGQEDSLTLALAAYRPGVSVEGEALNRAYHEFGRYQQWIRNLVDLFDGPLNMPVFIGWMYALPAKCPRVVRLVWWIVRELIVKEKMPNKPAEVHKVLIAAVGNEPGQENCFRLFGIEGTTRESPGNLITASPMNPRVVSLFPFLSSFRQKLQTMEWAQVKMSELREFDVPVTRSFMEVQDRTNLHQAITF
jgi:hypothetical protein